ncbi:diaminopimelate epimerase [Halorussus salilacus]|uniref:diaminopimelate epimerase n=1 Tax=Halorussus salilacus TaxID=2953750 RepID=UPI00209DA742|nr:diaminopimelate epimerase [Halorussus salilacus]USZ69033.1 diaminopimelate epimerase [Halorussus salilacus]
MSIAYQKYHGTSNDFVIVDADEYVPDRSAFARAVCDPRASEGVGADGVLFLALEPQFSPPRAVMTLVQPDGSTAAMCGNGARCAARWAAERTGANEIMLDTQAGTRRAEVDGERVTIEMGEPTFAPRAIPVAADEGGVGDAPLVSEAVGGLEVTAVNTGVPHAVAFVEDVDAVDLESVAPAIRHAEVFPEGANVNLAAPRPDGGFDQRTYERGVEGETRSCGTGAVAIAAVARRLGRLRGSSVAVHPPGGRLDVAFRNGRATLTGPTVREFEGEVASTPEPRRVGEA